MEFFIDLPVSGIEAAIPDHFIMLFGDMLDKTLYELHNRNGFFHILVIFVPVVMEGNKIAVISVNSGGSDDRPSKIASDILHNGFRVAFVGFGIDIKAFFMFPVAEGFYLSKRRTDFGFHFIEKGSTEGIAKEGIVEVFDIAPRAVVAISSFRNEAVDMRIPF